MRVISGKARHLALKTPPGSDTRPTTDRIKETLFNMLAPDLYGCRFLDLFAGSGAIGIEALSRGAACACFVERAPGAVSCIRENLAFTHLEQNAKVYQQDVMQALRMLEQREAPFDIIFMDPPYGNLFERKVLYRLSDSSLAAKDGLVIVEADLDTSFEYLTDTSFKIWKEKRYKTNRHVFLKHVME